MHTISSPFFCMIIGMFIPSQLVGDPMQVPKPNLELKAPECNTVKEVRLENFTPSILPFVSSGWGGGWERQRKITWVELT